MGTKLIKNAQILVTMDPDRREIPGGGVFIRDNVIEKVGLTEELPETADEIIDLSGHIVLPGFVNTHHHYYQTLTRVVPAAQDAILFNWLKTLYPIWANLSAEAVYYSTLVAAGELMLSGCTTSSDHLYIFPNDCRLDDEIRGAQDIGIRFHAARGSMSLGESKGGLPPDRVVEDEADIIKDSIRLIETYHDPEPNAMLRVVLAPCSPFSVTGDLMKESVELAYSYDRVLLHTHLAETLDEEKFCIELFGMRPVDYMESVNWLGDRVWHVHCVHMNDEEIRRFGATGTGVVHCPSSNMRLASGIAPIRKMIDENVSVGIGVDGSASNDGSHLIEEARQALLLQRVMGNPAGLTAREALELATLGGARVLRREDDIGSLEVGKAADMIAINTNRVGYAGAIHDLVAAVVMVAPAGVDWSMINGEVVVKEGRLTRIEIEPIIEKHNEIAVRLLNGG